MNTNASKEIGISQRIRAKKRNQITRVPSSPRKRSRRLRVVTSTSLSNSSSSSIPSTPSTVVSAVLCSINTLPQHSTSFSLEASSPIPVLPNNLIDDVRDVRANDRSLSFNEWFIKRRATKKRPRCMLNEFDYQELYAVTKDNSLGLIHPHLKWARRRRFEANLTIAKFKSPQNDTVIDAVAQETIIKVDNKKLKMYKFVIYSENAESIIKYVHESCGHAGILATFAKLGEGYIYGIRDMVEAFIARCEICSVRTLPVKKTRKPLHPIRADGVFHHMVMDLIDFSHETVRGFNYVIHLVDHFTSFHYVDVLTSKNADDVLNFVKKTFSITGIPLILHTDNGTEFSNKKLEAYCKLHKVDFRHGQPYRPQTQGKVEKGNQDLQRIMNKKIKQSNWTLTWCDVLFDATLAVNTNHSRRTKNSAYYCVYHRLPLHTQHINYTSQYDDSHENSIDMEEEKNDDIINSTDIQNSNELQDTKDDFDAECATIDGEIASNIDIYIDAMKSSFDKYRNVELFYIGDCVGVIVPKIYIVKFDSKLVPAIVLSRELRRIDYYYTLGIKGCIIEGYYASHDLVRLNYDTYKSHLGIPEVDLSPSQFDELICNWGYNNIKKSTTMIPLKTAYELYVNKNIEIIDDLAVVTSLATKNQSTSSSSEHLPSALATTKRSRLVQKRDHKNNTVKEFEAINISSENNPANSSINTINATTSPFYQTKVTKNSYYVLPVQEYKDIEEFILHYISARNIKNQIRWTAEKLLDLQNAALTWKTTIKDTSSVLGSKINKHIKDNPITNSVHHPRLPNILEVTSIPAEVSSICCICSFPLSADNWHKFSMCKKPMHGKIICTKGESIFADDDKLFCSKECYETRQG